MEATKGLGPTNRSIFGNMPNKERSKLEKRKRHHREVGSSRCAPATGLGRAGGVVA